MTTALQRICIKLYAPEPQGVADSALVPIFHEWIRQRSLPGVLLDVADYTHVPDGPGVLLVTHSAILSLDRSDGRFGLLVQRRRPPAGAASPNVAEAIADVLGLLWAAADALERDPRLAGKLAFDRSCIRIEANDRLRAPNTTPSFTALAPLIRVAVAYASPGVTAVVSRVDTDPRDRLAVDVRTRTNADGADWGTV